MSDTKSQPPVVLERASQEFVDATATPPFIYELTPADARKVLDDVQAAPIDKLDVDDRWITVPAEVGDVRVRIVRPPDAAGPLPVILYMHGGGWVLGNADTHDRLVRELAVGTGAAVVFVEYDRSPEARYPVAIEQGYATAQWVVREGAANQLDRDRMAVAGDSVGGNMAAALALMANERGDVRFVQQSMYYPVTDAAMDTGSYEQFAEGYFLTAKGMAWFWDAYLPDVDRRSEHFASPLRARDEQLAGLPPAFIIVDEADVLRDEGEAYAARLRAAGNAVTTVRYDGITHDFMMLNPLSSTHATRAAVAQAISILPRRPRRCEGEIIVKVVVIGGTGLIGSNLVKKLRGHGHESVPAAPNTGVNTLTGEGLNEALAGADRRRRRLQLALVRGRRCARVLRDVDAEHPAGGGSNRGGTSRGAVRRRQRSDL